MTAALLSSPHNPTGRAYGAHELMALERVASNRGLLVISDEIWADVVFTGRRHVPFAMIAEMGGGRARHVAVSSASKAFSLAGLRCAVAEIAEAELAVRIAELPDHLRGAVSTPGAVATLAALDAGGPWLADTVAFLGSRRDHLAARLAAELPKVR